MPRLKLSVSLLILLLSLTAASGAGAAPSALPDLLPADIAVTLDRGWRMVTHWLGVNYARRPEMLIALGVVAVLPVLAIVAVIVRRMARLIFGGSDVDKPGARTPHVVMHAGPAWVQIEGAPQVPASLMREMTRIGRDADNEICLADASVHRFHALIHRSDDDGFFIRDVSGERGNGVLVNGRRLEAAPLNNGDVIQLGRVHMRFQECLDRGRPPKRQGALEDERLPV